MVLSIKELPAFHPLSSFQRVQELHHQSRDKPATQTLLQQILTHQVTLCMSAPQHSQTFLAVSSGAAVFPRRDYILTCLHNLNDDLRGVLQGRIEEFYHHKTSGLVLQAIKIARHPDFDLAVIQLNKEIPGPLLTWAGNVRRGCLHTVALMTPTNVNRAAAERMASGFYGPQEELIRNLAILQKRYAFMSDIGPALGHGHVLLDGQRANTFALLGQAGVSGAPIFNMQGEFGGMVSAGTTNHPGIKYSYTLPFLRQEACYLYEKLLAEEGT